MGGGTLELENLSDFLESHECDFCKEEIVPVVNENNAEDLCYLWLEKHCISCKTNNDLLTITDELKDVLGYWPEVIKMCTSCLKEEK